jgi:hypothetical protein
MGTQDAHHEDNQPSDGSNAAAQIPVTLARKDITARNTPIANQVTSATSDTLFSSQIPEYNKSRFDAHAIQVIPSTSLLVQCATASKIEISCGPRSADRAESIKKRDSFETENSGYSWEEFPCIIFKFCHGKHECSSLVSQA